jgi:hypothetical protein
MSSKIFVMLGKVRRSRLQLSLAEACASTDSAVIMFKYIKRSAESRVAITKKLKHKYFPLVVMAQSCSSKFSGTPLPQSNLEHSQKNHAEED